MTTWGRNPAMDERPFWLRLLYYMLTMLTLDEPASTSQRSEQTSACCGR